MRWEWARRLRSRCRCALSNELILIVEDNPQEPEAGAGYVQVKGYQTIETETARKVRVAGAAERIFRQGSLVSVSAVSVPVSRHRGAARGMAGMTCVTAVVLAIVTAMPASAQTLAGAELLAALRAGGYVLYLAR